MADMPGVTARAVLAILTALAGEGCGGETLAGNGIPDAGPDTGSVADAGAGKEAGAEAGDDVAAEAGDDAGAEAGDDDAADVGAADAPLRVPMYHRPDDSRCAAPRQPGSCMSQGTGLLFTCSSDSECTDGGAEGRCTASSGGPAGCWCTYDVCNTDGDCPAGNLCACHDSPYSYGGNRCLPGNCRVDSDCGPHGYCSPSESCGYAAGYYCHTPQDRCIDNADCAGGLHCGWSAADERWECLMDPPCPV
jgi:hypothetical protein